MSYEPKGTLRYYQSLPYFNPISVAAQPTQPLAVNCQWYLDQASSDSKGLPKPDWEALRFYALNHLAMIVRQEFTSHEKLPAWAIETMDAYLQEVIQQGQRMVYYLALITSRESRHGGLTGIKACLKKEYGAALIEQLAKYKGCGSIECAGKFLQSPPTLSLSRYFNGLEYVFREGSFGSQFGGKPWANVAKTLAMMIDGKTSMEMMLDTAYTLAHNNGPIFNKGMLYTGYTKEIYRVLDVQRSGQIPEYLLQYHFGQPGLQDIRQRIEFFKTKFPEKFGAEVDWYKVEALGALHTYPEEKKAMASTPPIFVDGKPVKPKAKLAILPGVELPIYERVAQ